MRLHGAGGELLSRTELQTLLPYLDYENARFPIHRALIQPRSSTARHDAVV